MQKKVVIVLFAIILAVAATAAPSRAETLAWTAPTTYTDGTSIGSATITYRAFWYTSPSTLHEIGSAGTSTTRTFNVDTEGMTRGTTVNFTARAIVGGVESTNAPALSWNVPTKAPSAPSNVRMQ